MRIVFDDLFPKKEKEGYVVFSGRGYHFYGNGLMDQNQWHDWIQRAREQGDVEKKWCDIQMKRGYSILRLTNSSQKIFEPKVLYRVNRY